MKYWQVAAGDKGRNYSKLFLDHGIAFVGGEKHEKRIDDDVNINDIMVLKDGIQGILAAGKVVSRGGYIKATVIKNGCMILTDGTCLHIVMSIGKNQIPPVKKLSD